MARESIESNNVLFYALSKRLQHIDDINYKYSTFIMKEFRMNDTCSEATTLILFLIFWKTDLNTWGNSCLVKYLQKISLVLLIRALSEVHRIITTWSCHHTPASNTKHCSDMTCSSGILQFPAVKKMKPMCVVWTSWQLFKLDRHELLIRSDTPPDAATIKNKIVFLILKHPHNF